MIPVNLDLSEKDMEVTGLKTNLLQILLGPDRYDMLGQITE